MIGTVIFIIQNNRFFTECQGDLAMMKITSLPMFKTGILLQVHRTTECHFQLSCFSVRIVLFRIITCIMVWKKGML